MVSKIKLSALGVFSLGAIFYFYDFLLQVSPSVMAGNLLTTFSIDATVLGAAMGTYFYSYTFMQIPAGLLLDQYGAKRILPIVILFCAFGALLFGMSHGVVALAMSRLLMGVGSAFAFLSALYLALRWLPTKYFAIFAGVTQMLGSLGAASGEAPFAHCVNAIGWRATMIILGVFGLLLAALVFFTIQEKRNRARVHVFIASKKMWAQFKEVMKHQQTWPIGLYSFCVWAPIATFAGLWGVPFLKVSYHLSTIAASSAVTCVWFAVAFTCPFAGWLSETLKHRKLFVVIVALVGLTSTASMLYFNHQPLWLVYLELTGLGVAGAGQSLAFVIIKDNQPVHLTGAANGFNNMMIVLGGAIFQPLVGRFLDWQEKSGVATHYYSVHDFHFALTVLPVLYLLALMLSLFFIRESYTHRLRK